jgi:uncharacterized protein YacL
MIYFYNATNKSEIVKSYKAKMTKENQNIYDKIVADRVKISYQGYALGFLISLIIILYNLSFKSHKLNTLPITCIVIATSAITNYFYYILSPKSDSMLNYVKNNKDAQEWYIMYKEMQYNYHFGLALGIIAVGFLSFAFRC